jgi:glycosyltransferase involved in cell wall biosynthesis
MKASVIICSRNRIHSLLDTLDSLLAMDLPAGTDWELIVVDNASTDNTADMVRAWGSRTHAPVVVLEEPRPGKAYALNLGLSVAKGQLLLFTDDDAVIDRMWFRAIEAAFTASGADCVGGRVVPLWLGPRPAWLNDSWLNVLAMLDLGPEPRDLATELLYGVNYAFRREVFAQLGTFNTKLCARGAGTEDTELIDRLRDAGGRLHYDPRIVVEHKVFPERTTRAYFRRWYRLNGYDRAEVRSPDCRSVLGLERYMLRNFARAAGRLVAATVHLDREEMFREELLCRLYLGYARVRLAQYCTGRIPAPRAASKVTGPGGTGEGRPT